MFFTPRPTSTPALHNTRYSGWPTDTPPQLHHGVASPSRTAKHVTFDTPSHRSHEDHATHIQYQPVDPHFETNPSTASSARATRSSDIMDPYGYRRGSTRRAPSLQSAFEIRTGARHDKENSEIRHDPLTRRTKNPALLSVTCPHPLLAPPPLQLMYDLRQPPICLSFPSQSPYAGCGYDVLRVPLTPARPRQIRLISPDFPWAFDIGDVRSPGKEGVTCFEVLSALYTALQRPLTDTEWGSAGDDKRTSLVKARDRRLAIIPGENSGARTRPTVHFADEFQGPARRDPVVLRVDWLGSHIAFGGLVKDEEFARKRLIPGAKEPPETWVVNFQRLGF